MSSSVVSLFAGIGGWGIPLHARGLTEVALDWGHWVGLTRKAAGLQTAPVDVATIDPIAVQDPVGLVASPPVVVDDTLLRAVCHAQEWAVRGFDHSSVVRRLIAEHHGDVDEQLANARAKRAALVLEPARWIGALMPTWAAVEFHPEHEFLADALAGALADVGYYTAAGVRDAASFGACHRQSSFTLAHRYRPVSLPVAAPTPPDPPESGSLEAHGFPPGWPVAGDHDPRIAPKLIRRSIPPPLAAAVLGALLDDEPNRDRDPESEDR